MFLWYRSYMFWTRTLRSYIYIRFGICVTNTKNSLNLLKREIRLLLFRFLLSDWTSIYRISLFVPYVKLPLQDQWPDPPDYLWIANGVLSQLRPLVIVFHKYVYAVTIGGLNYQPKRCLEQDIEKYEDAISKKRHSRSESGGHSKCLSAYDVVRYFRLSRPQTTGHAERVVIRSMDVVGC